MIYQNIDERIAYRLGLIEGQLKRRGFEEDLVLALVLLRRLWSQFSSEFSLSDSFGESGDLFQTHAVVERRLFLDFLAGSPWPPLRTAVLLLERLFRATSPGADAPPPPRWFIDLAAVIETVGSVSGGSPIDRIEYAVSALFESHVAFSEGKGELVVRTFEDVTVHSFQGAEPSASWAFNLGAAVMASQLGLGSAGTPLPALVRREAFRADVSPYRRREILSEMLDASSASLSEDLDGSSRSVRIALSELRGGRRNSRAADAYVLIAGAGALSVRQVALLLEISHEGARKICGQLVHDGHFRVSANNTYAVRARGGLKASGGSAWGSSLLGPTPSVREFEIGSGT